MSVTPMMPGMQKVTVVKGKPTQELCKVCKKPMLTGQLHSGVLTSTAPPFNAEGVRVSDEGYVEGHYLCVIKALGPEETLKAIQQGRLPSYDPAVLVDGCLPFELGGI